MKCTRKPEVYSRIVGYFRPVQNWNDGKKTEYSNRKEYIADKMFDSSQQSRLSERSVIV